MATTEELLVGFLFSRSSFVSLVRICHVFLLSNETQIIALIAVGAVVVGASIGYFCWRAHEERDNENTRISIAQNADVKLQVVQSVVNASQNDEPDVSEALNSAAKSKAEMERKSVVASSRDKVEFNAVREEPEQDYPGLTIEDVLEQPQHSKDSTTKIAPKPG
jgi:hypothetical protein